MVALGPATVATPDKVTRGEASPFATSLAIAPPGPRAGGDGLSYSFVLTWLPRAGATAYRVFAWTDAARTWYRVAQTAGTSAEAHAFRSGCSAFVVVAVANAELPGTGMAGIDTTNLVRFPLSVQPALCPGRP